MAKILVVDDDRDAGETAVKLFQTAGHEAIYAPNGKEALSHVLQALPDVVLLDLAMPEMDGTSFLEVVRSYLRLQSLPVVVLTGLADSPMVMRAQALRVNSVLVKGKASVEEILHAVQEAVARMPG
jgi:CheY-like chemotaxis protein